MPLDVQAARQHFPAIQQDQVYFDNAGGSQALGSVIDSIKDYLSSNNVQLGASYAVGQRSTSKYSRGYEAGARHIGAKPEEIVYGPSTTQLFRNLSYALKLEKADEIVVSMIDHEANIAPWVDLADRQGLVLKWWKPSDRTNPQLHPEDLEKLLSSKTKLVTCTHASNILGTINNVKAIADMAHSVDALLCVDAVAYAPHRHIDVKRLGVDFYAFSWYKVYGPHIAMLYASPTAQIRLRSLGHFFNPSTSLTDKLGLAGGSYELLQAVPQVVDYLSESASGGWNDLIAHEKELQTTLIEYLLGQPQVTILGVPSGDPTLRVATVSFTVDGWDSKDLVEAVESNTPYGFRWGAFYSERLVREILGLDPHGVVRVSMVHYNTVEEVKGFIKALDSVLKSRS